MQTHGARLMPDSYCVPVASHVICPTTRHLIIPPTLLGISTRTMAMRDTAALWASTASIADIDLVIQAMQILRDDKATKTAGTLAPLTGTRKDQLACTFPGAGKVGMMKGGSLGKGGYSTKTRTFPACRDGQYCRCALTWHSWRD